MKKTKKKAVFPTGGKGGTGKSTFVISLAEWYAQNNIPFTLLDLDTENKKKGSLSHFFPDRAANNRGQRDRAGLERERAVGA